MKTRIAINGFGRIGRLSFREILKNENLQVVAVNDLADLDMMAHLLKYDSVHGKFDRNFKTVNEGIEIEGYGHIAVLTERNPEQLPWADLKVDIVLECTGIFRTKDSASKHITAGAKKVVISAPAKGTDVKTIVIGVNDHELTNDHTVVSNASCTTNCLAPMLKVMDENFGVDRGYINTIHAYTADQKLHDAPHSDKRRARAAAQSIIPTSTGAAKAVALVLPQMEGRMDGMATRIPVISGSITDVILLLDKEASADEINAAMKKAADTNLKGVMEYTEDPIVSSDIVSNGHSCIFDSLLTSSQGKMVKLLGWYDNEYGYASRCADLLDLMSKL